MAFGDPYVMWGTAPRSGARQPAASGVRTSAGAPRTNTVQPAGVGAAPQQAPMATPVAASDPNTLLLLQQLAQGMQGMQNQNTMSTGWGGGDAQRISQAILAAIGGAPVQSNNPWAQGALAGAMAGGAGAPTIADIVRAVATQNATAPPAGPSAPGGVPRFPTPSPGYVSRRVGPSDPRFGPPSLPGQLDPRFSGRATPGPGAFGGGAMGGEGGAMGAPAGAPGVGQRQIAQTGGVGTAPTGPQSAPLPTPPAAPQDYRFTPADIVWAGQQVNPQMAALVGFGPAGTAMGTWGENLDFFEWINRRNQANRNDPNWPNVQALPEDYSLEDFYAYFLDPRNDLGSMYATPGNPALHRTDVVNYLQDVYDYLELVRQGITSGGGTPTPPGGGTPTTPTPPFGPAEREAFRRPLSAEEQNLFTMLGAARTGRATPSAEQQARIQAMIDADLAAGRTPNIAAYVQQVKEAETSNPGSALYAASMGQLPPEIEQHVRENALRSMGNIGARFGTEAAGAAEAAASRVSKERMLEAQAQIQNMQGQAAMIDAQREQQAQQALYQEYLRNLPPSQRESLGLLLNLLGLNVGGSQTTTSSIGGGQDAFWSQILQAIPGLASAGLGAWNEYKGRGGGGAPGEIPTVLPPDYQP